MNSRENFDIVISGGGLVGLTMANALLKNDDTGSLKIALIAPNIGEPDGRTTALLQNSIDYLEELGIWQSALPKAATMSAMRIIDNTKRLIHAPEVTFKSIEIGLDAFGYNILNTDLGAALWGGLKTNKNFLHIEGKITDAAEEGEGVKITLKSGKQLAAKFVIGADGRNSTIRQCADGGNGIGVRQWAYPQTAIVLNFSHTLPHQNTSTEFHNTTGPFTVVPLEERVSSLVWVVRPDTAEQLLAKEAQFTDRPPDWNLDREIEQQMHSFLGKTKIISAIQKFPLSGLNAQKMASGRFFLVGEAAHVFPPIGAQGYNLGIRDTRELATLLTGALASPTHVKEAPGDDLAARYNKMRQRDVMSRTVSVDVFNRSLLSDFLPVQALRSSAIFALGKVGPLRRLMMREGISPGLGVSAIGEKLSKLRKTDSRV